MPCYGGSANFEDLWPQRSPPMINFTSRPIRLRRRVLTLGAAVCGSRASSKNLMPWKIPQGCRTRPSLPRLSVSAIPSEKDANGNALWDGVTLRKIMQKAAPVQEIVRTVFYPADGCSDSIPYSLSLSGEVFLASGTRDAELKPPLSKWPWTLWRYDWKPSEPRGHTITVRGIAKEGKIHTPESLLNGLSPSFAEGAEGLCSGKVNVGP
jgi:hypothetical protein